MAKAKTFLTDCQQSEIARQYIEERKGTPELAREFKVSQSYIFSILKRRGVTTRNNSECQIGLKRNRKRSCDVDETVFDDAETSEEASYWTGFLMADGNVRYEKVGQPRIKLALASADANHVEKFRHFLKSEHKLRTQKHSRGRSTTEISVRSTNLAQSLARYGVVPNKTFTAEVFHLENNLHFWRGCIDGDGSLQMILFPNRTTRSPHIHLGGSEKLMNQFVNFISLHFNKNPSVVKHNGIWHVQLTSTLAAKTAKLLYGDCTVSMDRKLAIARQMIDFLEYGVSRRRSDANIKRIVFKGLHKCFHGVCSGSNRIKDGKVCWRCRQTLRNTRKRYQTKENLECLFLHAGSWQTVAEYLDLTDEQMKSFRENLGL